MNQPKGDRSRLQINDRKDGRGLLQIEIIYKEDRMKTKESE